MRHVNITIRYDGQEIKVQDSFEDGITDDAIIYTVLEWVAVDVETVGL